jgi:hypothetical protein
MCAGLKSGVEEISKGHCEEEMYPRSGHRGQLGQDWEDVLIAFGNCDPTVKEAVDDSIPVIWSIFGIRFA